MDFLAVQGSLKSILQYHNSKASILWHSTFFIVQLSHPCMTTGKTIALTRWTFFGKVMSLLFNMLSRLVITFLQRSSEVKVKVKSLSRVRLLAILWTVAFQAPPSMGFSRQEYWSGLPLPSPYQPRQHVKKQRHYFAKKGLSSQSYGFSSSHAWM